MVNLWGYKIGNVRHTRELQIEYNVVIKLKTNDLIN